MEELKEIKNLLEQLLSKVDNQNPCPELRREWMPKREVLEFFGLKSNRMKQLEREYNLVVTMFGKQRFYSTRSVLALLKEKIIK
ncbi:hypothetical protein [Sediminibacterium sp.]|uniref:hypothetical protein n=1 Tax=Sediminibacterium sp. TaxID=1917865 RepID=UPI003F6FDE0E